MHGLGNPKTTAIKEGISQREFLRKDNVSCEWFVSFHPYVPNTWHSPGIQRSHYRAIGTFSEVSKAILLWNPEDLNV
jgi:hypothetical protein